MTTVSQFGGIYYTVVDADPSTSKEIIQCQNRNKESNTKNESMQDLYEHTDHLKQQAIFMVFLLVDNLPNRLGS